MDPETVSKAVAQATAPRPLSPTDISQFIRLDQCERYLHLRLTERAEGNGFIRDYGVVPQSIPPILTRSGARFEELVEQDVAQRYPTTHFTEAMRTAAGTSHDNAPVIDRANNLEAGTVHVLFQPRLQATVAKWRIRGDIDILRLERCADGRLHCLIADMKSSTATKVEHRLQVALYHEMISTIFAEAGIPHAPIALAVLYRGPASSTLTPEHEIPEEERKQREDAARTFGTTHGLLERIDDAAAYIGSVHDLVTGDDSIARRVLKAEIEDVPFHLTYKCDGCLYNEFCMKRSAETDDLSLLPHLTDQDKRALQRAGITTTQQIAALKTLRPRSDTRNQPDLVPAPGKEGITRHLAATWPVGQRLDELIHRAQSYTHWKNKEADKALSYIPNKGYGSLPYSDAQQNPNLVRIYIDAQHDYLHDRIYMLGALVIANKHGVEDPRRRRSIVRMTDGPPDSDAIEERVFVDWIAETIRAVVELAAPDENGESRAPIHLIFVNSFAQRTLLDGLARHATSILGATALYDFMTQIAAFDSPLVSFLDKEIREQKNYPMVCQSLQAVAAYLKFDWNQGTRYRDLFRERMFDFWGKFDAPGENGQIPGYSGWYTSRARFNSQIPLEYAYAAWDEHGPETPPDDIEAYREATPELLQGFHARRLEAMEHIAHDFRGNRQTKQTTFLLPDLAAFEERARSLAHALDEFVTIERHVDLSVWKRERLAAPEQRVLAGQTLIARYVEDDQEPEIAEQNRENQRRSILWEQYRAAFRAANPDAKRITLPKEQREESKWSQEGMVFRLRLECADVSCDLEEALNLSTIKPDSWLVLYPRWTTDSRLPQEQQYPFTPTAKQLLYGMRVKLSRMEIERGEDDRAINAWAHVEILRPGRSTDSRGFQFAYSAGPPLQADQVYTLDADPNDINGLWASKVTEGLVAGGDNTLYRYLSGQEPAIPIVPSELAMTGQRRFLEGLEALRDAGAMHDFEPSKREFIGEHGDNPVLLVQGPPGTGKSYSTAFALLARIQGAMAANRPFRALLSCNTHAATDVLLENVLAAQKTLRELMATHPGIVATYFDLRLLTVPLFRQRPRGEVAEGITPLPRELSEGGVISRMKTEPWTVTASTPGGIYNMVRKNLFGEQFIDCAVLDEASQMSIPDAITATLPLKPDGRVIVVGDHRQMPPIISHDWANEPRRSFKEFKSYESFFFALLPFAPPMIKFEESFRLHADMAEFLRAEIYVKDGINYHSRKDEVLPVHAIADAFVAAVLAPEHPLTVVVHDEAESQHLNPFEEKLITPILQTLADPERFGLDAEDGLGVVVPHRAQRAALQEIRELAVIDPETGEVSSSAVDTVERFQGGERTAIVIGATESDRDYLLQNGNFLLDPRRLTVALSRAKRKMVLVASRSVFEVFSSDEEMFANAQLWKNLLRRTCTKSLWEGERHGRRVEVWGNVSSRDRK